MTNNGTLDTRASQYLVREEVISAKQEYGRFNPKKISGGNAIWITNIPPNVKVWYSTDNNFEHKQRLDYMNRGTRYSTIGQQGQNQLFDNFYIFTEGTADEDILINVASSGDAVTPILSSNTNQIDQVDAVAEIGTIQTLQTLQTLQDISDNVLNKLEKKPTLIQEIDIFENTFTKFKNNSVYTGDGTNIFKFDGFKFKDGTILTQKYIGKKLFFKMSFLKIGRGAVDTKPIIITIGIIDVTYDDGSHRYNDYEFFNKSVAIGERVEIEVTIPIEKEIWKSGSGGVVDFLTISNNTSPQSFFLVSFYGGILAQ